MRSKNYWLNPSDLPRVGFWAACHSRINRYLTLLLVMSEAAPTRDATLNRIALEPL